VLHLRLIILSVEGNVPHQQRNALNNQLHNIKIKPTQSFINAHRDRVCMRIFIGINTRTCMSIYVCTAFLKKFYPFSSELLEMSNPHLEHLNPLPPSPIHTLAAEPNHIKPHGTRSPRPCKPQSKPHWISGSGGQANRSDRPGPHTAVKYTSRREADRCRTCGAGDENAHRFLRHGCRWGGFAKVLEARGVGGVVLEEATPTG
jgi:hypothetical protein